MEETHWWRWAIKVGVTALAIFGLYTLSGLEPFKTYQENMWKFLNSDKFRSSISNEQRKHGVVFSQKRPLLQIKPKTAGLWRVSTGQEEWSDGADLGSVIFSAGELDVIEISPGIYPLDGMKFQKPILIKGVGAKPSDVVLEFKDKIEIDLKEEKVKRFEMQNLTVQSHLLQFQSGPFLNLAYGELDLIKTSFKTSNYEFLLKQSANTVLFGNETQFTSGDQFDTLVLLENATLDLVSPHFYSSKVAITTPPNAFTGKMSFKNGVFENLRAHALIVYGGQLLMEKNDIQGAKGGIYFGRECQATLKDLKTTAISVNALEIYSGSKVILHNSEIEAEKTAALVIGMSSSLTAENVKFSNAEKAIHLRDKAQASVLNAQFSAIKDSTIILERQSTMQLAEALLEHASANCLKIEDSKIMLRQVTMDGCQIGLNLNQNSEVKTRQLIFKNNIEKIKNNFNSSKIVEF